jgi:hypothetical protein
MSEPWIQLYERDREQFIRESEAINGKEATIAMMATFDSAIKEATAATLAWLKEQAAQERKRRRAAKAGAAEGDAAPGNASCPEG